MNTTFAKTNQNSVKMIDVFKKRVTQFQELSTLTKSKSRNLSIARVFVFLVLATALVFLLHKGFFLLFSIGFILSFLAFGALIRYHNRINREQLLYENLAQINLDEVARQKLKLDAFEAGEDYLKHEHPFSYDLDIFGKHSLFQLISRCTTSIGKDMLAHDLQHHQNPEGIKARQAAIKELASETDWRQELEALGRSHISDDQSNLTKFFDWLKKSPSIRYLPQLSLLSVCIWIVFAITFYFIFIGQISFLWLFAFNVLALIFLGPKMKVISDTTIALTKAKNQLDAVHALIEHIEKKKFRGDYLGNLQQQFREGSHIASQSIGKLIGVVDLLNNRGNNLYLLANSFLLFDFFLLHKAEKWRLAYAVQIENWFQTIGKFEILLSYSAFAFANPDYAFPEISKTNFTFSGRAIGHPLIDAKKRVSNDFQMSGKGTISLITGSNMAGKSTFLRSLGINLVLAQVGAPVCAAALSISPCMVFTSMRTKDNLEENISTFYAELIRINSLLKNINEKTPSFFLLDEILKGTNSHDRHIGALAIMKQLNQSNAFGLVSTHDVELNELTSELKNFKNFSFHSTMKDGKLLFDYKLWEGPCLNFNAIELMKKMGISIS